MSGKVCVKALPIAKVVIGILVRVPIVIKELNVAMYIGRHVLCLISCFITVILVNHIV